MPAFDRGNRTDVSVNLFVDSKGALTIVGTAKLSSSGDTDRTALRRTPYGHAFPSKSAADHVVIESVKVDEDFSLFSYSFFFQCGEESKFQQHWATCVPLRTTHEVLNR